MANAVKILEAVIYLPNGTTVKLTGDRVAGHDPGTQGHPVVAEIVDKDHPQRHRIYVGFPYTVVSEPYELEIPAGAGRRIIHPGA